MAWPTTPEGLIAAQLTLASAVPPPWPAVADVVGAVFVCFGRGGEGPGAPGDRGWAGAVLMRGRRLRATSRVTGTAGAAYAPGLLALREGPLLEAAVDGLPDRPDVLLVNATGRDHPRRAGLALHLGAVLGVPTVGVTHRPLLAVGEWPAPDAGAASPVSIGGEVVGFWVRTRRRARPLVAHAAWRTDPEMAQNLVVSTVGAVRTPEPLRQARRVARTSRGST